MTYKWGKTSSDRLATCDKRLQQLCNRMLERSDFDMTITCAYRTKEEQEKAFKDGKALPFKELTKLADKATKVKLRKLSIAQITNYAYTGLVLGIGIPKLNIYLTGRREAKKAAMAAQNKQNFQVKQNSAVSSTGALPNNVSMSNFMSL